MEFLVNRNVTLLMIICGIETFDFTRAVRCILKFAVIRCIICTIDTVFFRLRKHEYIFDKNVLKISDFRFSPHFSLLLIYR